MAKQFSHPPVTLQDGMILAVQMLQELESEDSDDCSIFPEYRTDSEVAQRNVVMEYLDKIQTPEAREGFTRVLSDFVAC